MALRLKGQEVAVTVTGPDGEITSFNNIGSFSSSYNFEALEENYLGQTAPQYDTIYQGCEGSITLHLDRADFYEFVVEPIRERAARRVPAGTQYNITKAYSYPNGDRVRITYEDVQFDGIDDEAGGRADYVEITVNWKCSQFRVTQG